MAKQADLDGDEKQLCRIETRRKGKVRLTGEVYVLETTVNQLRTWQKNYMDTDADVVSKIEERCNVRESHKRKGFTREEGQDSMDEIVDSALHVPPDELPTIDEDWRTVAVS